MRFVKQRNGYTCGPIALLNLGKALGLPWTYKSHFKQLVEACQTDKDGTIRSLLQRVMHQLFSDYRIVKVCRPTLATIEELVKDNVILVSSAWKDKGMIRKHAFVVDAVTEKSLKAINIVHGSWITKDLFKRYYMDELNIDPGYPTIWAISRKKKIPKQKQMGHLRNWRNCKNSVDPLH